MQDTAQTVDDASIGWAPSDSQSRSVMPAAVMASAFRSEIEEVYRLHGARLWRAVFAFTRDRDLTDDAVSEAFAQALRRGNAIRRPDRWVWKAAFKIAAGSLKERRAVLPLLTVVPVGSPEPDWELLDALQRLRPAQRASLVLHYYGGYQTAEIARIIGSTPAAVRMQLTRGRRNLEVQLAKEASDA